MTARRRGASRRDRRRSAERPMPAAPPTALARLLNLVPYLLARPGHRDRRGRRRPRRHRAAAARGPGAAVGVRAARLRPGRPDRHGVRRRQRHDHVRRRHRPAAAADPGRGAGAGRGAADAGRDAGHRRPGRDRAGARQDRDGGRRPRRRAGRRTACPATPTASPTIRGAVERRHALRITYYTATRDETTERVIDPMRVLIVDGPGLPRGVVPPGRGGPACSGSTGSTASSSSTSRPCRRAQARPTRPAATACSGPAPTSRW